MCQPYSRKKEVLVPEEYEALWLINQKALHRVMEGKGKDRHYNGEKFTEQDICVLTREEGWGYPIGQARKKINEAKRMFAKGDKSRAINEILDASIYLQALALVMEEEVLENWQNQQGDRGFTIVEGEQK
jgi:hypothetical protein